MQSGVNILSSYIKRFRESTQRSNAIELLYKLPKNAIDSLFKDSIYDLGKDGDNEDYILFTWDSYGIAAYITINIFEDRMECIIHEGVFNEVPDYIAFKTNFPIKDKIVWPDDIMEDWEEAYNYEYGFGDGD